MNGRIWGDRQAGAVMQGIGYALGLATPDIEFFEAQSSSMDEAFLKMKQYEAMRNRVSDGQLGPND